MCRHAQIQPRLIRLQDALLSILPDHCEPSLVVYMAGNSVSPMEDVHSASDKVESENDEPVASQPPALAQPKPQRPTGRSDLLSPCIPTTPTHTPALSNDVPVGPVSSKRLIQGLQEIQNHTEGGVVVQSRFGTPTEQQGTIFALWPYFTVYDQFSKY